ncbi:MAG: PepSY-associated TM helix domain-containing protein [Bacteroidetes bacterium]|nr:PepSY-associated TM helix domain-containing protein [Bacteroidota bacterium]MBU1115867.1 PepSY-associated TM helix domain-containing protein [Bacteroidota bacterium]MBU1797981.1 PepSY-associated TM helix domain-containing protein [Bacteroidota bacterium]
MIKWRRLIRVLHRDIGYVAATLTVIYSISGIAVNHINDWNPNYIVEKNLISIKPIHDSVYTAIEAKQYVVSELNITDSIKSYFRTSPHEIDIFLEGKTFSANLTTGDVIVESIGNRRGFKESNFLHLNKVKNLWTWIADLFAVALIFLAISGFFMIKGKQGFFGRGKWFLLLGTVIPILFLVIYYYV